MGFVAGNAWRQAMSESTGTAIAEMSLECGTYLLGILIGELFHRVSLLIEESYHTSPRHKKCVKKMVKSVLSNKHHQYVKVPLLVVVGVLLQYYGGNPHLSGTELVTRICPVVAVWACLRMFGAFDNSLEDMEILEESNAELGPGLAANYWFSFLKPALKADIRTKMEENLRSMRKEGVGANYRNFPKLILPLPDDCNLNIRDEGNLKEKKEKKKKANKIFIIFDFPQLLQSPMGPRRGWEEHNRPGARIKNIKSFEKTLKKLLQCNDYIKYQKDVLFISFPNTERMEDGDQKKPLSAIFRERILQEELRQEAVYSSSSCSDSDIA